MLLSESAEELQRALACFEEYCDIWKLKINTSKTKIVIFSKNKVKNNYGFKIYDKIIDIQDSYSYLGIVFNHNGNFCTARKKLLEQAQKSMYALYKKIKNISIPVDLQLKLFDSLVAPVLLYASEIWGFENKNSIEKVQLQFCKSILKVRSSTPNFLVYGELGRFPLETIVKQKMILFWNSLLTDSNKLSHIMYKLMLKVHETRPVKFKWVSYTKSILDDCGLSFIWNDQIPISRLLLKSIVRQKLNDQFIQNWSSQINNTSRGKFYSLFKEEFQLESYLLKLNTCDRIQISKLRCSNFKFPIETGRWSRVPREDRICNLCRNGLGDEFHYLFTCNNTNIKNLRDKYIPQYYTKNPTENKMKGMLSICHVQLYKKLSIFLKQVSRLL